jgi:acetyl esterase/lipase
MQPPQAVDAEVAEALALLPDLSFSAASLSEMRSRTLEIELTDLVERTDHVVSTDPCVVVRVHRAKSVEGDLPCVFSIHGGGYVAGSYAGDDARFDRWCVEHRCLGVSVEYRLAPETCYPGPLDDCYAALAWTYEHAAELGADPDRIGVIGYSAGGGLAAALGLVARDRGEIPIRWQALIYPMLDDRRVTVSSGWEVPIWKPSDNHFGWSSYLGERFGTDDVPTYAAAARATDLRGLPPTFLMVGALDIFHDEDVDFANRLTHAGVPTELHVYPGAPHAFDGLAAGSGVAHRANAALEAWLTYQLGAGFGSTAR